MDINFFDIIGTEIYNFRSFVELKTNILDTNLFNILACLIWAFISLSKVVKKPGTELKRNKQFRDEYTKSCVAAYEERTKAARASEEKERLLPLFNKVTRDVVLKRQEEISEEGRERVIAEGRKRLAAIYREGGG